MFCCLSDLRNESAVEQFFIIRLLNEIGYKDANIFPKHTLPKHTIGKGVQRKIHRPDYAIKINKIWSLIVEAKHPEKDIEQFVHEAQDYASIINRGYVGNPIKYCLITNGIKTQLVLTDQTKPILELKFDDFFDDNEKYKKIKGYISYNSLKSETKQIEDIIEFREPKIDELNGIFQICHNIMRDKHKISPKTAFYDLNSNACATYTLSYISLNSVLMRYLH